MREQARQRYTCAVCGGPARRRTSVAVRIGNEDADQPLLHVRYADWADNPHDVVPTGNPEPCPECGFGLDVVRQYRGGGVYLISARCPACGWAHEEESD